MKRITMGLVTVVVGLAVGAATASELSRPEELVRNTTDKVLERLEANADVIKEDPKRVSGQVEEFVLPHFDFRAMSQMVLARHWRKASDDQKERFVEAFRQLLIRTYGNSLAEYSGQRVEFKPMHSDPERGRVTVAMRIHPNDGPSIPVEYKLYQRDDQPWKVFDVVVDGVSLVQNYRGSFGSEVKKKGLDALIERIEKRNASRQPDENAPGVDSG